MAIEIIEANQGHIGALAQLHSQLFAPAWDEVSFSAMVEQPGTLALLAVSGEAGRPVGFMLGRIIADEAEILTLGVSPEWQRQRIAAQLVKTFACRAAERGASRIFLEVAIDNFAARQLYLSQGFSEVGRRPGYYERQPGPLIDALIMSKTITDAPTGGRAEQGSTISESKGA